MTRFNRPRATGGGGFARYDYEWSEIGLKIRTERVAVGTLKALYGPRAAAAAIREAQRVFGKNR
jgi:hypothetical protein